MRVPGRNGPRCSDTIIYVKYSRIIKCYLIHIVLKTGQIRIRLECYKIEEIDGFRYANIALHPFS